LLAKIYLSTAVAASTLFAAAGWFFQHEASLALHHGVEHEVRAGLGTVDATMQSRAEHLSTASGLLASMSDVRSVLGTDRATIIGCGGEVWARAQEGHEDISNAALVVAGPGGTVQAAVAGRAPSALAEGRQLPAGLLDPARRTFPKQSSVFAAWDGNVWQ